MYTFYSTNDIYIILPLLDINFFRVLLIDCRGSIIIFCKQTKDRTIQNGADLNKVDTGILQGLRSQAEGEGGGAARDTP
jgi:hypothetical protein